MNDAFIYLWYDAPNKKYYLGVHNGKDPYYTHSAQSSEEFRSIVPHSNRPIAERKEFLENIPKGISRKKIAYGTDEEMCILEHELLVNRKKRCWNRYYNESLGDPRYVDQSGENNPLWKGGIYINDPKAYMKAYGQTPRSKTYDAKRDATPERKAYKKAWESTPERLLAKKLWMRKYRAKKKAETQGEGTLDAHMG